ncbi:MAG: alanine--tRNA ligase-related protein, partial [Sphaerochaeta sp.]
MNTYPRYYDDPYQKTLKTTVRSVEGSEVILTETIFYPEGGGQGGDWGTVNECKVTDTIKNKEGEIIHF